MIDDRTVVVVQYSTIKTYRYVVEPLTRYVKNLFDFFMILVTHSMSDSCFFVSVLVRFNNMFWNVNKKKQLRNITSKSTLQIHIPLAYIQEIPTMLKCSEKEIKKIRKKKLSEFAKLLLGAWYNHARDYNKFLCIRDNGILYAFHFILRSRHSVFELGDPTQQITYYSNFYFQ